MNTIIKLLQAKNKGLEKFLELSKKFLSQIESESAESILKKLQKFHQMRESALKAFDLYDKKIGSIVNQMTKNQRDSAVKETIQTLLARKDAIIQEILSVDLQIIGKIETVKSNLLKESALAQKGRETLRKFRSEQTERPGDVIDKTL